MEPAVLSSILSTVVIAAVGFYVRQMTQKIEQLTTVVSNMPAQNLREFVTKEQFDEHKIDDERTHESQRREKHDYANHMQDVIGKMQVDIALLKQAQGIK